MAGDLTDPDSLELPEVDWLVYAAAGGRTDERYAAIYPGGLANVLDALPAPLSRALFVSSTAVYGD
ncbi:MAG: SDR family NAD(P)-dependent oxidoreductase, partial [Planctomycetota bacterium]